jgi:hypothetical protein
MRILGRGILPLTINVDMHHILLLSHYILPESLADVIRFWSYLCQMFIKSLNIW